MNSQLNIIFLFAAIQGILLLIALYVRKEKKPSINIPFLILIISLTVLTLLKYFFNDITYSLFPQFWYFVDSIAYFICLYWYLTLAKSYNRKIKFKEVYIISLICMLPHLIFLVKICFIPVNSFKEITSLSWFKTSYYAFAITVFIQNAYFLFKANKIISSQKNKLLLINYIQKTLFALFSIGLISFGFVLLISKNTFDSFYIYNILYILVTLTIFGLTFICLIRPEYFYFIYKIFKEEESRTVALVSKKIKDFLHQEKPYLNTDFSLKELATEIGHNTSDTSKAINYELNSSFSNLINQFRTEHFIKLVANETNNNYTHWALAQSAGFGNKASFYKHFKRITGKTPKAYFKSN